MLFAHSWKDAWLVLISLGHLALLMWGWSEFENWAWPRFAALGAVLVFLNCTNYQCVAHNFLHNPFFTGKFATGVFSIINSVSLGMPQTLYKYHHLNHHQFNNDLPDPVTHATRDRSSTFRFARPPGREENILSYSLLGPFRMDLLELYATAKAKRRAPLAWLEILALAAFSGFLIYSKPYFYLQFVLPVWYLGQVGALAENFLEHHHARPGNRLTDSVSCYGWLYNWIWFNNGYHQEHHFRPTVHWTEVVKLREKMLPESQRRVVRGAHWFNFGGGQVATATSNTTGGATPDQPLEAQPIAGAADHAAISPQNLEAEDVAALVEQD